MSNEKHNTSPAKHFQTSLLRRFSMGYAGENRDLKSNFLEVYPAEVMPYADGEITAEFTTVTHSGVDAFGNEYSVKMKVSNTLKAEWWPFANSNRMTPPDIRRAERVEILKYGDADQYFWVDTGMDQGLRRRETVVFAFSNTTDETTKVLTPDNAWMFAVSTHTKEATLRTNKNDGEKYAYFIQVNAKDGNVTIQDDDGQSFQLDSANRAWTIENKDGSMAQAIKGDVTINGPDSITHNTKKYTVNTQTYALNASQQATVKAPIYQQTSSTSYTLNTATYTMTASTGVTWNTPLFTGTIATTNISGVVNIAGLLSLAGGIAAAAGGTGSPTATFAIPLTVNADVTTTGALTNNGVDVGSLHTHKDSIGGNTSPPTS